MFENMVRGFKTASATRKLIFKDKELFLYPIISCIVALIEAIVIFGSFFILNSGTSTTFSILWIVAFFLFYVLTTFTSTYFIMALLIAFRSFAAGKKMGMGEALGKASSYTGLILEWAVFYSILLMILRAIENRMGGIGRLVIGAIGAFAISLATMFAVQVILDERVGPIKAVEESVHFITKNFGATFGGLFYADLWGIGLTLLGILVFMGGLALFVLAPGSIGVAVTGGAVAIAGIVIIVFGALVSSITFSVYKLILYDHYKGAPLPEGFTKDMFESKQKKNRSGQQQGGFAGPGGFVQ